MEIIKPAVRQQQQLEPDKSHKNRSWETNNNNSNVFVGTPINSSNQLSHWLPIKGHENPSIF